MIFLFVMPMAAAFANYLVPLQIGARDVAFPRINAFGFWCFLVGGIFLNTSWFLGGAADGGWFCYAPNTERAVLAEPRRRLLGARPADHRHRLADRRHQPDRHHPQHARPGHELMKMPIFTWMVLVVQFLLLFAIPVITVALFLLMFQRDVRGHVLRCRARAPIHCSGSTCSGSSGIPRCTSSILPSFGIVSEVLPVFTRKPLFGYPFVVFSGAAIGFLGWGVWAHHMFASGLGPICVAVFSVTTMFIAMPDRREDRQLDADHVGRQAAVHHGDAVRHRPHRRVHHRRPLRRHPRGVAVATRSRPTPTTSSPTSTTCCSVAPCSASSPASTTGGRRCSASMLNETLGKWNFWLMVVGMNLTFGPMHILGLQGQPRRMYVWTELAPVRASSTSLLEPGRQRSARSSSPSASSCSSSTSFITDAQGRATAPLDPWDARSFEWMTTSPPKEHNFDAIPHVHALDEFFHRKYEEDPDTGRARPRCATAEELHGRAGGATPTRTSTCRRRPTGRSSSPSACRSSAYGVIFNRICSPWSAASSCCSAVFGWALEPSVADDERLRPAGRRRRVRRRSWPPLADTRPLHARRRRRARRPRSAIPSTTTAMHADDGGHGTPPPGCRTTSWRCGCSSAASACCSAA